MSPSPDRHRQAFEADPDDIRAFDALQEAYFLSADWPALADLYRRRLEAPSLADDARARGALQLRLAQVLDERCLDPDSAEAHYWEAVRLDRSQRIALRQLRRIHAERGEWDQVLQIAEIEETSAMKPFERASFLAEMGNIWLDRLGEAESAQAHFERALAELPEQVDALDGLARAQQALGRNEEAAATWSRLVEQQRGPDRAVALVALAALYEGPLGQPQRAIELYRRALSDDPRHPRAVEALLADAREREQWALLADLLERRLALATDDPTRVETALEASRLELEHLGNPHAARMWLMRARELHPDSAGIHFALADLESRVGNVDAQLAALDRALELAGDTAPVGALVEAGTLHAERGAHDRALPLLRRALEREPGHPLVCEALSETLAQLGRHDELAEVLERRAALAADDPDQQADLFAELGGVHESELDDPAAAVYAFTRAFQLCPTLAGVAAALERLHRKAEDWTALRALLERARVEGPPDERAGFHCSLGEVLLGAFDDADAAARAFEAALELDGADPRALQGFARVAAASGDPAALLRAREREASVCTDPRRLGALAVEIVRELEALGRGEDALAWAERWRAECPTERAALETVARLQEALGRDDALADTLERLDALLPPDAQAAGRRRLAALHIARGDGVAAVRWLEAALEREPQHLDTLHALVGQLERLARGEGRERAEALARAYRRLADAAEPPERDQVLQQLVDLLADRLGDLEAAIVVGWRIVQGGAAPEATVRRLEGLLERAGRFEELVQLWMEERRRLVASRARTRPEVLRALDLRLGKMLLERLSRFEDAAAVFRRVREAAGDEHVAEAERGLEAALRGANDFEALSALLAERAQAERDPARRASVELERAGLLEEALGELEEARECYARLSECEASREVARAAGERLERLLERSGDWTGQRALLERRLERGGLDPESELALRERVAGLCRDRLGDAEGCVAHLEAAGRVAPERVSVWRSLALLHEQAERWDDVVRSLEAELATGPERAREEVLRSRAAELSATRLQDPDRARRHYTRLLELDPSHAGAMEFCIERAEAAEDWPEVGRLLALRLSSAPASEPGTPSRPGRSPRTALRLRLAAVRADRLDDVDGALEALEPALDEVGVVPAVTEPLAALYARSGRRDEMISLCERAAQSSNDPLERATWRARLGESLRERGDRRRAAEAFGRALADRPDDTASRDALRDLYRELGEHRRLAELLEEDLASALERDETALRVELAALVAGPLDRPEEALAHLRRALQLDPAHLEAFERALRLAERLGLHPLVDEFLVGRLSLRLAPDERADLLQRRAELLERELGRAEDAVGVWREALAAAPERREARAGLRSALEGLGRWPAVLDCLYLDAQAARGDERARILEQAAHVAQVHLGSDAALPWLERLRAERPRDGSLLARIADVHRRAARPEALLRTLEDELELASNPDRRRALHVERARVLELSLAAPARAAAALEEARRAAPEDPEVLAELDRLYAALDRTRDRVAVIEDRLALPSDDDRAVLHREAAALWAGALGDPERAVAHCLHALALDGGGDDARRLADLRRLQGALLGAARRDAWARAAEDELRLLCRRDLSTDAARIGDLRRTLAEAYGLCLANRSAALRHLRALVDGPATGELREWSECELLRHLRAERDTVELAERLEARLRRRSGSDADGPARLADAAEWLELGRLREETLHEPGAAARAYAEVLARDPACREAARAARRCAERRRDGAELARALDRELALLEGDEASRTERAALWRRLGEVSLEQLGDRERAARAWARAVEEEPSDRASLQALQAVLEAIGDPAAAAQRYRQEIELLGRHEPERRAELWLRVAEIARDDLRNRERALESFERADECAALTPPRLREWMELLADSGDALREIAVAARWCDHPASTALARDHVALAERLESLERGDEALARARRATVVDPDERAAWDALARLCDAAGDPGAAADALERAGELSAGPEATQRFTEAALRVEDGDAERASALLRRAVDADPTWGPAQAQRARLEETRGHDADAEDAAGCALDRANELAASLRVAAGLAGGRAARRRGRLEPAARFFAAALAAQPGCTEALEAQAEVLFELGDHAAARPLLERRLAVEPPPAALALELAMLGRALEEADEREKALARYEAALGIDADLEEAHAGRVRVHEAAGRREQAVAALEAWAERTARGPEQAALWVRAAALTREASLVSGSAARGDAAERQLRRATEADPGCGEGWSRLATLLWEGERRDEALAVCERGLAAVETPVWRASLALVRGRALEAAGAAPEAAEAYAEAMRCDPRGVQAALACARLRRAGGDWRAAADALEEFGLRHPDPNAGELVEVYRQLARLCAGPLEDMERAIRAYERALAIQPDLDDVRAALAGLLSHRPERGGDAVRQHAALLEEDPTRAASLRALVRLAGEGGASGGHTVGLGILRALGAATPAEREGAPRHLAACPAGAPRFATAAGEALCAAVHEAGSALCAPLGVPAESDLEAALVSAEPATLERVLTALADVALDAPTARDASPEQSAVRAGLAEHLGRWSRRKVRRTLLGVTPADIAAIDFAQWQLALRVHRGARRLEADGDLRAALVEMLRAYAGAEWAADAAAESADLSPRVRSCPEARALLAQVVGTWTQGL